MNTDPYMQALLAGANSQKYEGAPEFVTQEVPCTIAVRNDVPFVVQDVNAWGYMEDGIFATGEWQGSGKEVSVLIPYHSIRYIEFDFEALERFRAGQAEAVA